MDFILFKIIQPIFISRKLQLLKLFIIYKYKKVIKSKINTVNRKGYYITNMFFL